MKAVTARYRIVLNGFRVYQESYDDQLNMDGQHDEVYAAAAVAAFEQYPRKVVQPTQIVRSALHGDASRGQVQVRAGSVMPSGGIANGDTVPNLTPAAPGGTPSMHTFPLLLWEGTLTDDKELVSIRPVLWEWDGGTALYDEWARTVPSRQAGDGGSRLWSSGWMEIQPTLSAAEEPSTQTRAGMALIDRSALETATASPRTPGAITSSYSREKRSRRRCRYRKPVAFRLAGFRYG